MKILLVAAALSFTTLAISATESYQMTVEAGKPSAVNKKWIHDVAKDCGVKVNIDTYSGFSKKSFYVTYTGEFQNALCFWDRIKEESVLKRK